MCITVTYCLYVYFLTHIAMLRIYNIHGSNVVAPESAMSLQWSSFDGTYWLSNAVILLWKHNEYKYANYHERALRESLSIDYSISISIISISIMLLGTRRRYSLIRYLPRFLRYSLSISSDMVCKNVASRLIQRVLYIYKFCN